MIGALDGSGAVHKQRALLYVGSSQASFISESGTAHQRRAANANINSSKKISCADMNTLALLSIYDVWAAASATCSAPFRARRTAARTARPCARR